METQGVIFHQSIHSADGSNKAKSQELPPGAHVNSGVHTLGLPYIAFPYQLEGSGSEVDWPVLKPRGMLASCSSLTSYNTI